MPLAVSAYWPASASFGSPADRVCRLRCGRRFSLGSPRRSPKKASTLVTPTSSRDGLSARSHRSSRSGWRRLPRQLHELSDLQTERAADGGEIPLALLEVHVNSSAAGVCDLGGVDRIAGGVLLDLQRAGQPQVGDTNQSDGTGSDQGVGSISCFAGPYSSFCGGSGRVCRPQLHAGLVGGPGTRAEEGADIGGPDGDRGESVVSSWRSAW